MKHDGDLYTTEKAFAKFHESIQCINTHAMYTSGHRSIKDSF